MDGSDIPQLILIIVITFVVSTWGRRVMHALESIAESLEHR